MNKWTLALLAIALCLPALAFAQSSSSQQETPDQVRQQQANQAAMDHSQGMDTSPHHEMTGTVNEDGTHFTNGDTVYQVQNPGALKNYFNQNVTIKFQLSPDSNKIKITKVNPSK